MSLPAPLIAPERTKLPWIFAALEIVRLVFSTSGTETVFVLLFVWALRKMLAPLLPGGSTNVMGFVPLMVYDHWLAELVKLIPLSCRPRAGLLEISCVTVATRLGYPLDPRI